MRNPFRITDNNLYPDKSQVNIAASGGSLCACRRFGRTVFIPYVHDRTEKIHKKYH